MSQTNETRQYRIAPIHLHLIRGGYIILNAWGFGGVTPFGNVGTMLTWENFDDPLYVFEDPQTVLNMVGKATGLGFSDILDLVRNDKGYQGVGTLNQQQTRVA